MLMPRRKWASREAVGQAVLGLYLVFAWSVCPAGQRGLPAQEGILNFGKVNLALYRGAQPDTAGLKNLQRLRIKTIISLRMPGECWKAEATEAAANGLVYTNVPLRGLGRPTEEQVRCILALLETCPKPVFVHCEHGCDRTGTVVACYRIQHDRWSAKDALEEARRYGLSWLERGMRKYIEQFAAPPRKP